MDFPNCPKRVLKKLSWDLENENFNSFFAFTGLFYFQVLQIGSRGIINQLIKPVNVKKVSILIFQFPG